MIRKQLNIPTYSRWMYFSGYSPQEIYASGKQHIFELAKLEEEVPPAMNNVIEKSLDKLLGEFNR